VVLITIWYTELVLDNFFYDVVNLLLMGCKNKFLSWFRMVFFFYIYGASVMVTPILSLVDRVSMPIILPSCYLVFFFLSNDVFTQSCAGSSGFLVH
jgi:hypothetical protein